MAIIFALMLLISFSQIYYIQAVGQGEWISKYRIENLGSGQLMKEVDFNANIDRDLAPIFAGAEVNVTFSVDIETTASYAKLTLRTNLQHSSIQQGYWELHSMDYPLLDYNPNSQIVEFNQVRGTLELSLYGKIPSTTGSNVPVDYIFVTLYGPSGETLDLIEGSVITAALDEFQTLLEQKEEKLQSMKDSGVDPGFTELYENMLEQAQWEADQGQVESAIRLLNSLEVSNEPVSGIMEALFLPIVGIVGVLAAIFVFLYFRGRGQIQYMLAVVEDQIKDLEGLTLRVSKIDRSIGTRLEGIKDRLKSLVGM
ncbi:MAG: hypothetical protein AC479_07550 [miscellaneous Crenarchaeota group-6 archaeon AD8-1]|nr:MAG: hypothetical protein AC479_07550 [miscellaneous Crenarchaeota group-6 archaeon AD8-1]